MDSFRLVEVWLSQGLSLEEVKEKLRIMKGIIKQLDGRTVGLIAYNNWNTKPESCWCPKYPHDCKACSNAQIRSPLEKWMSVAHDFDNVDVVVQVDVSDVAFYGFAVNGEILWRSGIVLDCDQLPEAVIKEIEELEKLL